MRLVLVFAFGLIAASASAQGRDAYKALPYFTPATANVAPKVASIVGPVEGHDCVVNPLKRPSQERALDEAKEKAYVSGADGIVDVSFKTDLPVLGAMCLRSITAVGTAVKFEK